MQLAYSTAPVTWAKKIQKNLKRNKEEGKEETAEENERMRE